MPRKINVRVRARVFVRACIRALVVALHSSTVLHSYVHVGRVKRRKGSVSSGSILSTALRSVNTSSLSASSVSAALVSAAASLSAAAARGVIANVRNNVPQFNDVITTTYSTANSTTFFWGAIAARLARTECNDQPCTLKNLSAVLPSIAPSKTLSHAKVVRKGREGSRFNRNVNYSNTRGAVKCIRIEGSSEYVEGGSKET